MEPIIDETTNEYILKKLANIRKINSTPHWENK